MTINSEHFDALVARAARILSPYDFQLPKTPEDQFKVQMPQINVGSLFKMTLEDKRIFAVYQFQTWENSSPHTPAMAVFLDHQYQMPFRMTAWQFWWLAGAGRVAALIPDRSLGEQTALNLTPRQRKEADRCLQYVEHYFRTCEELNDGVETTRLLEQAKKEVAERLAESPPANSTIYRWIEKLRRGSTMDRLAAIAPKINPGNATRRISARLDEVLQIAVKGAVCDPKGTWKTVSALMTKMVSFGGEYPELAEEFAKVSDRLLQRRLKMVDHFTYTYLRYGPDAAARISSLKIRLGLPENPLDVVDVDHTTLDVIVYDPTTKFAFGRPDIVVFRDRHSGAAIGFHIGFGGPSFASFLAGLKHACFPKDPSTLPPGVTWPWFGVPVRLGVDNAMHLIGKDIAHAGRELGFQIIEYRPARPWEKGAMERLFGITNQQLVHRLPGSTTESPQERDSFDDEKQKAMPLIAMDELHGFLSYYLAEVFNRSLHAGLGPLITLEDYPCDRWDRAISHAPPRPPVDPEIFSRLVGYTDEVTIQRDGIRLDYLIYQSPELHALKLHPRHKDGKGKHGGTKYTITRDNRVDRLYVRDPYRKIMIEVPVSDSQASYANGLTLYEHRMVVKHHYKRIGKIESVRGLMAARRDLEVEMAGLHKAHRKHDTARQLAKFINADAMKMRRSRIVELSEDQTVEAHMDYSDPVVADAQVKMNPMRRAKMPVHSATVNSEPDAHVAPQEPDAPQSDVFDTDESDDGIDAIRSRNPGWEEE